MKQSISTLATLAYSVGMCAFGILVLIGMICIRRTNLDLLIIVFAAFATSYLSYGMYKERLFNAFIKENNDLYEHSNY